VTDENVVGHTCLFHLQYHALTALRRSLVGMKSIAAQIGRSHTRSKYSSVGGQLGPNRLQL
jgi:hypothetical protein